MASIIIVPEQQSTDQPENVVRFRGGSDKERIRVTPISLESKHRLILNDHEHNRKLALFRQNILPTMNNFNKKEGLGKSSREIHEAASFLVQWAFGYKQRAESQGLLSRRAITLVTPRSNVGGRKLIYRNVFVDLENSIKRIVEKLDKELELGKSNSEIKHATSFLVRWALSREQKSEPKTYENPINVFTWVAAKAQVPGLMKWDDARANPDLTIIDHLRNEEIGYGRWATHPPGLPRNTLLNKDALNDAPAYYALYAWLAKTDPKTGQRNQLPEDLYLPTRHEALANEEVDPIALREANRIVRKWQRIEAAKRDR